MSTKVVLLNDTSTRYHHGCSRVIRLLRSGLEDRGATISATVPARANWPEDTAHLDQIRGADIVVINGEGTLHHGVDHAERLLRIADHPVAKGKKLCLVNALYDKNPESWRPYLERFDLLSARDSESARQMSSDSGRSVGWVPDLSLSADAGIASGPRHGVVVGDSVRIERRRDLARSLSRFPEPAFIPTKTLRQRVWRMPIVGDVLKRGLFAAYCASLGPAQLRFELALTEADYLRRIGEAELHVTGRFHAVCLSILTETPFLAVDSVSGKIARLLRDLGLGQDRIVTGADLMTVSPDPRDHAFLDQELVAIRRAREMAKAKAATLFDTILA